MDEKTKISDITVGSICKKIKKRLAMIVIIIISFILGFIACGQNFNGYSGKSVGIQFQTPIVETVCPTPPVMPKGFFGHIGHWWDEE